MLNRETYAAEARSVHVRQVISHTIEEVTAWLWNIFVLLVESTRETGLSPEIPLLEFPLELDFQPDALGQQWFRPVTRYQESIGGPLYHE